MIFNKCVITRKRVQSRARSPNQNFTVSNLLLTITVMSNRTKDSISIWPVLSSDCEEYIQI